MATIEFRTVRVRGAALNVATAGEGPPLLLLHGWPEFWMTWEPVMRRLAPRFRLVAPDFRGFGESDKPDRPWGAEDHAKDLVALLDVLGIERCGVVAHDVGGSVSLKLGRLAPERVRGFFLFGVFYPGIGHRMGLPDHLKEIWYQSFHLQEMAPAIVGASRESCRTYIAHFLRHWAVRKDAFDDVLEAWTDNFLRPGNLEGGFGWYKAANAERLLVLKNEAPRQPPITVPACVRWPDGDPLWPYAWTDRLWETFSVLDLRKFEGVGHFPHREAPDRAAEEIAGFFSGLIV